MRRHAVQSSDAVLGGFVLRERLGKGGMATVWRGEHRSTGMPVAVKVAAQTEAASPQDLDLFAAEVEAVAGLDHPSIVRVFDHGVVPASASGPGRLAGMPYLVMEHASGGSLDSRPAPRCWDDVKGLLLAILDALGHAHARGVLHCDLKPANLLMCGPTDARPGLKLADFGAAVAFRGRREGRRHLVVGTPHYMAPEHRSGRWRAQGPQTDLYGVGCLAWKLVTGGLPRKVGRDGSGEELHPFTPTFAVPPELHSWLAELLELNPLRRPPSAAVAALSLLGMGAVSGPASFVPTPAERADFVETWVGLYTELSTQRDTTPGSAIQPELERPSPSLTGRSSHRSVRRPPLPRTWRRAQARPPLPMLAGVGAALFHRRSLPVTGRQDVQDALWNATLRALVLQAPQAVVVRGPRGSGRSRVLRWLATAVSELGAADVLSLRFGVHLQEDGVRVFLEGFLRAWGLSGPWLSRQVQARLAALGVVDDALTDQLREVLGGRGDEVDALVRLVRRLSQDRPVLVTLDDIAQDPSGQRLFDRLSALASLASSQPPPLCVVASARDGTDLRAGAPQQVLSLGPLEDTQARDLLSRVIGLHPSLTGQVLERAEGNPGFMVRAVATLIRDDQLVLRDGRLGLRQGTELTLPRGIRAVWETRLDAFLRAESDPENTEWKLILTTALGRGAIEGERGILLGEAGAGTFGDLPARLVAAGLAHRQPDQRLRAAHPALSQVLERRARDQGVWSEAARLAAEVVARRPPSMTRSERLGRLHVDAGAPSLALPVLKEALISRAMRFEWARAHDLLDLAFGAAEAAGHGPDSP